MREMESEKLHLGLASYEFRNGEITFNLSQMKRAIEVVKGKVDLLCFGETFLQGFDALSWEYERDREVAVSQNSKWIEEIRKMSIQYEVDLLFGYIEKEGENLYSSCMVMEKGKIIHNYRRISPGWKEEKVADFHYKEGNCSEDFFYKGKKFRIALCGDMWDMPKQFQTAGILIWPVYVNFTLEEWKEYEKDYAKQAYLSAKECVLVNSLTKNPISLGGAFHYMEGEILKKAEYGKEEILVVEV